MSNNPEMDKFIIDSRSRGISDEQIKGSLLAAGWDEGSVNAALGNQDGSHLVAPLAPKKHFGMWVSFEYILMFITLYISATALGGIARYAAQRIIKDPLQNQYSYYDYSNYVVMGYLAAIIVAAPFFIGLYITLMKQVKANPDIRNLRPRKFLMYLTMVVTFITLMGHLIATVYGFLTGTTTSLSIVNFLITVIIAGSIFWELLTQVRQDKSTGLI